MDKHYGWQEGRGSQNAPGRMQNGQRWNERNQNDDRDMRSGRGGEFGGQWDQNEGRWASGGDLDREDYVSHDEEYGGQSRGGYGSRRQGGWSQGGGSNRGQSSQFGVRGEGSRSFGNQGGYGNQGFSGGHYGGFANEGSPGQGNYGGNRGFSNQGYSGQGFNQGTSDQGRGFSGQGSWTQGGADQSSRNQSGQSYGQTFGMGYAGRYEGRGFAGRGPKGYQRSDDRIKEQVSDRLMDDDDVDASEISIEVKNGEVTLTGTVNSREEKRAAEEIVEQAPGVREVQNLLRVQASSSSSSQSGQQARTGTTPSQKRNTERE